MTVEECVNRLEDLRIALKGTKTLVEDEGGLFYQDSSLKTFCKKYKSRIMALEELLVRGELEDSRLEVVQ